MQKESSSQFRGWTRPCLKKQINHFWKIILQYFKQKSRYFRHTEQRALKTRRSTKTEQ